MTTLCCCPQVHQRRPCRPRTRPQRRGHPAGADRYPNFSICGIPYHVSGDVPYWRSLAHCGVTELKQAGLNLHLNHRATAIDPDAHTVTVTTPQGDTVGFAYDRLVIGTGDRSRPSTTSISSAYTSYTRWATVSMVNHGSHRPPQVKEQA
jgi:hypothetical protein